MDKDSKKALKNSVRTFIQAERQTQRISEKLTAAQTHLKEALATVERELDFSGDAYVVQIGNKYYSVSKPAGAPHPVIEESVVIR